MQAFVSGPRQHLTYEQVLSALENPSPFVRHGADVTDSNGNLVDPKIDWATGGQITYSYRAIDELGQPLPTTATVRRTATLTLIDPPNLASIAGWKWKIWTELYTPDGTPVRFNRGVYQAVLPSVTSDGVKRTANITLADQTWILDRPSSQSVTVPVLANRVKWVKERVKNIFGIDLHTTIPSGRGGQPMVFPAGTSESTIAAEVLQSVGYENVFSDDDGVYRTVPVRGKDEWGEWRYSDRYGRLVPGGEVAPTRTRIPNILRVIPRSPFGGGQSPVEERRNEDFGPHSIESVGPIIQTVVVEAVSPENLSRIADEKARLILRAQTEQAQIAVGLNPLHADRDIISFSDRILGVGGQWEVVAWTQPLRILKNQEDVRMRLTCIRV